uniref:Uncharacterized protein n=1 Tax=Anguilla anguilla TaxID=7936 RepID=A0A0E9W757_ANGAN
MVNANTLHTINTLLDVEDSAQDPDTLADSLINDVSIYRTSDDIASFNNTLHTLQNGAGCTDASSNHGLDSVDIKRLVREGGVVGDFTIVAKP